MASYSRLVLVILSAALWLPVEASGSTLYWTNYAYDPTDPEAVFGEVFSLHKAESSDPAGTRAELVHSLGFQPAYASLAVDQEAVYIAGFPGGIARFHPATGLGGAGDVPLRPALRLRGTILNAAGTASYIPNPSESVVELGDSQGATVAVLAHTPYFQPNMVLALDELHGKIYWAGSCSGCSLTIQRADLDGSNIESIPTGVYYDDFPAYIAVDPIQEKLYWANLEERSIQRANLDGSNVEDFVTGVLPFSMYLDVAPVPEPASSLPASVGVFGVLLVVLRRRRVRS